MNGYDWPADNEPCFPDEQLKEYQPSPEAHDAVPISPAGEVHSRKPSRDPGSDVLLVGLGPNNPELLQQHTPFYFVTSPSERTSPTTDRMETVTDEQSSKVDSDDRQQTTLGATEAPIAVERHDSANVALDSNTELEAKKLAVSATAVIEMSETRGEAHANTVSDANLRSTPNAAQGALLPLENSKRPSSRAASRSPLTVRTTPSGCAMQPPPPLSEPFPGSPNLAKHAKPVVPGTAYTLPAVQPNSPIREGEPPSSPHTERLPSFQQFKELSVLAQAAETREPQQPYSHHHSQSFGSATSQSPRLPYQAPGFPISAQTSPVSHYAYNAMSPTSTVGDIPHPMYGSPQQYATPAAYYGDRRMSSSTESAGLFPPSLPSAGTSSSDSHGHTGSSTDGYSTNHTTPVDQPPTIDGTPRPILPPPPGMLAGFKCDWDGCTAPPFQTQYLLSSHRNVHSSTRDHYCQVAGCPRGPGGNGFKRKNEMIRHGLVHNSPGYICPFCPDREHKYPRPDNLQRHVRVHHVDKDKDDPALREVLAQRIEGLGKQRRRRTNANGNVT